ncbi:MAG: response regulator transcription factor [Opitutae bacterium]|nr:response regulator transcription factor [Opitutae bacterium]
MTRVLIVDDDVLACAYLRQLLGAHADISVVGEATSLTMARDFLAQTECDLIFLDILLGDGSGFDLIPDVPSTTRVIIVSTHEQFAVRAFDINALDYLVKPATPVRLSASLARRATADAVALRFAETVHLRDGNHARIARIAEICAIEAEENYSRVHLLDGSSILVRRPLKAWEADLPSAHFLRVHRTGIVNLSHIKSYRRDASGSVMIDVANLRQPVPVGRTYWPAVKARLGSEVGSATPFPPVASTSGATQLAGH